MSSKKLKTKSVKTGSLGNGDISKYSKKLTAVSKKKTIIGIAAAAVLVAGGAGIGGYFISKAKYNQNTDGVVFIDPSKQNYADVTYTTNSSGDRVATVTSEKSGKIISSVEVTIGGVQLNEGTEYKVDKIVSNGGNHCQVTIFKSALEKHSGAVYVAPIFEDEVAVVIFNSNGGTSVNVQQVKIGSKAKRPENPVKKIDDKSEYDFCGWYLDETLTKEFNFDSPVTTTTTLYAKWSIPKTDEGLFSFTYNVKTDSYYVYCSDKPKESKKEKLPAYLRIPETYEGKKVTGIARPNRGPDSSGAFSGCEQLVEVVIPSTIEWIDSYAFAKCYGLTKVTFEGPVKYIYDSAFKKCTSLTEITFNEGLELLGDDAFASCSSLKSVKLPNSLYQINEGCFHKCSGLNNVVLGENLTRIGDGLTNLDEAEKKANTIKAQVQVAIRAQEQEVISAEDIKENYRKITEESGGAFEDCVALKNINIPDSVTSISADSFKGCKSLSTKGLKRSDRISAWGNYNNPGDTFYTDKQFLEAIKDGHALYKKMLQIDDYPYLGFQYAGSEKDDEGNIRYYCTIGLNESYDPTSFPKKTTIEIPDKIEYNHALYGDIELIVYKIADDGFYWGNTKDKLPGQYDFVLPSTIEFIGNNAFAAVDPDVSIIKSLTFKNDEINLKSIGDYAFVNSALTKFNSKTSGEVNIPEKTLKIGANAFSSLTNKINNNLKVAKIPASIEEIPTALMGSDYLSLDDGKLSDIRTPQYVFSYPFFGTAIKTVNVDGGNNYYASVSGNLYSLDENGKYSELISCTNFEDGEYTIADGTTSINDVAFMNYYCYDTPVAERNPLKTINFSDQLSAVNNSFYYYKKLMSYSSSENNAIGNYSLSYINTRNSKFDFDDKNLVLYNNTDRTTLITSLSFDESKRTEMFEIPDSVEIISNGAFMKNGYTNSSLRINWTSKLKEIGAYAFAFNNFIEMWVPQGVTKVGAYIFCQMTPPAGKNFSLVIASSHVANVSKDVYEAYYYDGGNFKGSPANDVYVPNNLELDDDSFLNDLYEKGDTTEGKAQYTHYVLRNTK